MSASAALRPFRTGTEVVAAAAPALRPPPPVLVSEAAARHRYFRREAGYRGPWDNAKAPYLVEPMDAFVSRAVSMVVFAGPSQSGKTEIPLNVMAHATVYRPVDVLMFQPSEEAAKDFGRRRVSRELFGWGIGLADALGGGRGDDTILEKVTLRGNRLSVGWPTAVSLSSRPVPVVILDERDRMADDIGGEGDPVELGRRRTTTFGKDGKVGVFGSPSRTDGTGILAHWGAGDRRRLHVACRQCGDYWAPGFDADGKPVPRFGDDGVLILGHLHIPAGADTETARREARLVCPACGYPHPERDRRALLASGRWVPDGQAVEADGSLSGPVPMTRTRSYWLHGLVSAFKPWGDLAAELVDALAHFERTGEEAPLKAVLNTGFGVPFASPSAGGPPLDADDMAERREGWRLGTVPPWVRFLVGAVDVQGDRFEAAVWGFTEDFEAALVDRFAIRGPEGEDIRPGAEPECWHRIRVRVMDRRYPLADDPARSLPVATTAVDMGGVDGVTEHAKRWWRECRPRPPRSLMLVKGHSIPSAPPLGKPSYELWPNGKANLAGPRWYMIGVTQLKDTVANRLRRKSAGPGAVHLPRDLPDTYLAELVAERRDPRKGWQKTARRNETWDLLIYGTAAAMFRRPRGVDWSAPPPWATARTADEWAALDAGADPAAAEAAGEADGGPAPAPKAARRRRRGGGFKVTSW